MSDPCWECTITESNSLCEICNSNGYCKTHCPHCCRCHRRVCFGCLSELSRIGCNECNALAGFSLYHCGSCSSLYFPRIMTRKHGENYIGPSVCRTCRQRKKLRLHQKAEKAECNTRCRVKRNDGYKRIFPPTVFDSFIHCVGVNEGKKRCKNLWLSCMEHQVRISAHHGLLSRPNELKAAKRLCQQRKEIDCLEIDFVTFRGEIISSHDYDEQTIARGSPLGEWLEYVATHQLVLWIDVKQNEWFYFNGMYGTFDVHLFFQALREARRFIWKEYQVNITHYVWIGCQNCLLREALQEANGKLKNPWQLVLDLPFVKSYVYKALLPTCMASTLARLAEEEILNSPYKRFPIISIDRDFFSDEETLIDFLRELRLKRGTRVILNSFPRSVKPIEVNGLDIVMQYDYPGKEGK